MANRYKRIPQGLQLPVRHRLAFGVIGLLAIATGVGILEKGNVVYPSPRGYVFAPFAILIGVFAFGMALTGRRLGK